MINRIFDFRIITSYVIMEEINMNSRNAKGFTLVEIIAAIVIIGIIFISFFSIFISSQKVTVASEEIIDATYIAQQAMEETYSITSKSNYLDIQNYYQIEKKNTTIETIDSTAPKFLIKYTHDIPNITLSIQYSRILETTIPPDANVFNVLISVYENNILKSQMENIINLKY
jgi:prepilin-type N-terminal cleavage/methylation domain-containing protein